MIKKIYIIVIAIVLMIIMNKNLVFAQESKMAHNIYSDPILPSESSGKYDTFLIDFKGTKIPIYTYWALCNFDIDLTAFKEKYNYYDVTGGGAYAGLQNTEAGRKGIMSFWQIEYYSDSNKTNKQILNAKCMYPTIETNFGNEGSGVNYIGNYNWESNKWYRMALHSWTDKETGNTFVGQWFQNIETGKWILQSYFDLKLQNSALTGGFSMFQENYIADNSNEIREFNLKNMYIRDLNKNWTSLNTTKLSYDHPSWGFNTKGLHEFGAENEYFWGRAGGYLDNQSEYDSNSDDYIIKTIQQPNYPDLNSLKISNFSISDTNDGYMFEWDLNSKSNPQLAYKIEIIDLTNNSSIYTIEQTRPEINKCIYKNKLNGKYNIELSVTDIFGNVEKQNKILNTFEESKSNLEEEQNEELNNNYTMVTENIETETKDLNISNDKKNNNTYIVVTIAIACTCLIILVYLIKIKISKN